MGPYVAGNFVSLVVSYSLAPGQLEAAGGDHTMIPVTVVVAVQGMVLAEALLPVVLEIGFTTRFAAIGMVGQVQVTSAIDVFSGGAPSGVEGGLFDANSFDQILDPHLSWIRVLSVPSVLCGGWL
jgi:putative oxidoreductase